MTDDRITRLSRRPVYHNDWMSVYEDQVRFPGGTSGIYGVVEKPDFVAIVPLDDRGRIHLVSQFRYPVGQRMWELPMGVSHGTPEQQARAELREETGLIAGTLRHIGHLFQAPGFSAQGFDVFLATDLTQGQTELEVTESDLIADAFPWPEVQRMIAAGEITDAATIAALGLLLVRGLLPPG
ncbi:NUDIX domain-containing protein [Fuscibacter oryzae]|uniref:GDP-mannose pyrophosphatase n=1 Tax=Fuscibacter oryzae TaxID=2803939 RepID=A0A8J7MQS3_9RHOB|nr:NUDIX hydrolase [Fuscibacter oryzae]MBL4927130.1 NUDIX hydrolase [Fuscibacter oryzae]